MVELTTSDVWRVLAQQSFMVLGMVSARGAARTAGVMLEVDGNHVWSTTNEAEWKAKHLAANPQVSVTVPVPKRVPFVPWVKVPAATITFSAVASLVPAREIPSRVRDVLLRGLDVEEEGARGALVGIRVEPVGDFVTYGVGVSLLAMRDTDAARGRVPVR